MRLGISTSTEFQLPGSEIHRTTMFPVDTEEMRTQQAQESRQRPPPFPEHRARQVTCTKCFSPCPRFICDAVLRATGNCLTLGDNVYDTHIGANITAHAFLEGSELAESAQFFCSHHSKYIHTCIHKYIALGCAE